MKISDHSRFGGGFGQAMLTVPLLKGGYPGGVYCYPVGFTQEPEFAQDLLFDQPADQVCLQSLQFPGLQFAQYSVHRIAMRQVKLKIAKEVFSETLLPPGVVVSIARGLFEQVHEQTPGHNLDHLVFLMLTRIGQLVKPIKKIGEAGINHFADSRQDDFPFF